MLFIVGRLNKITQKFKSNLNFELEYVECETSCFLKYLNFMGKALLKTS